jgi:hypothetical protein
MQSCPRESAPTVPGHKQRPLEALRKKLATAVLLVARTRSMLLGAEPRDQLRCDCRCSTNKRLISNILEGLFLALRNRGALLAVLLGGGAPGGGLRKKTISIKDCKFAPNIDTCKCAEALNSVI